MSTATATVQAPSLASSDGAPSRSLSVGFLAMLPLLIAGEAARAARPDAPANAGELVLNLALSPLRERATLARWVVLALAALIAWLIARRRKVALGAGIARVILEGLGAAALLGPLMVILVRSCSRWLPALEVSWDPTAHPPSLIDTAFVFGAGPWEELLFRVGAYSFTYWLIVRFLGALDMSDRWARASAEFGALALSSLAFAAAHFEPVMRRFGVGGRAFDPALLAWLCLGGVLLGILFRWRGPGVAAWAHGLFNVALWIGVDPAVIW